MTIPSPSADGPSIWIDADACPVPVKDLVYRTAERRDLRVIVVANQSIYIPSSPRIRQIVAPAGMNMADRQIIAGVRVSDLVITADIPLAAEVIALGADVIHPRGDLITDANIGEQLGMRDLVDTLRGAGQVSGGPAPYNAKKLQAFANQLDRWVTRSLREKRR